ncbi:peptidoglycan-binding protein [Nonomuraea sp. 3-1Str]|uniref:efflux RND transporter periplasmic adaptor subunit n=1 Tax=Nonomuraea sp. 3-1Str TaxID=2929801 RepID=UPI002860B41D|nr:peptidoglycan-binding domain-containing protein [Nonomuraea sp. 3-1Str]MDR8412699.1 peptidoglycan-binding protein [Nonomuraea sp. 3-1Str]
MTRTTWVSGILAAAVLAAAAWLWLHDGAAGTSPRPSAGGLPPATAKVIRQTLIDTQTEPGTLGYGPETVLSNKLSGTLTRVPAVGATVRRGKAVYRVDDTPVTLLYGSLPAYRALSPGVEGADVEQFERNLRALGYKGFTVDDSYSSQTATAVRAWQDDLGLPETGTVELGRVAYAPSPIRVDAHKANAGDTLQPGTQVLAHTGTTRVVTVELEVSEQRLAAKGAAVSVELPDGKTVKGKIAKTQVVIDTGGDSGGESADPETKIEVTIAISGAKAAFDQASVDVAFTASSRKNVLTVPVTALLALAEGGYGVQAVDGTTTRIVRVRTGLFADGRVEVSGDGLREGMTVGMPS